MLNNLINKFQTNLIRDAEALDSEMQLVQRSELDERQY